MERNESPPSRLRTWRLQQQLTLQEIADLTGVSQPMLSQVERGLRELAPLTKVKVARRLGVPVRDLFDVEPVAPDGAATPVPA